MRKFALTITTLFALIMIIDPTGAINSAKECLVTCYRSVIPALFPFFLCSNLYISLGLSELLQKYLGRAMRVLFGVSGSGAGAVITGFISGYPVGAKTVSQLVQNGQCSQSEGEKLLAFCNNSGPLFLLGTVGSVMLQNTFAGMVLYLSHMLGAITVGMLLRGVKSTPFPPSTRTYNDPFGQMLSRAVSDSVSSILNVCGYVVIFGLLMSELSRFDVIDLFTPMFGKFTTPILYGLLEPVGGCFAACEQLGGNTLLLFLSAIVGFSGISVHLQVMGLVKEASLSVRYYFIGKTLMTIFCPIYTFILIRIFNIAHPVFAPSTAAVESSFTLIYMVIALQICLFALLTLTGWLMPRFYRNVKS